MVPGIKTGTLTGGIMFAAVVDPDPLEGIVAAGVVLAVLFSSPPSFAALFFGPLKNDMAGSHAEGKVSGHPLGELFGLVADEAVDVAESHPEQSPEDIFCHRDDLQSIHMDSTVALRLCHSKRGGTVVKRRQHHDFGVAFFDPLDHVDTGEAIHPHGQVFGVILHHAERQNDGHVFINGFTDLVGEHVQVLHNISFQFLCMIQHCYCTKVKYTHVAA